MTDQTLPLGKLPAPLLARLLARAPVDDPAVLVGPDAAGDVRLGKHGDPLGLVQVGGERTWLRSLKQSPHQWPQVD